MCAWYTQPAGPAPMTVLERCHRGSWSAGPACRSARSTCSCQGVGRCAGQSSLTRAASARTGSGAEGHPQRIGARVGSVRVCEVTVVEIVPGVILRRITLAPWGKGVFIMRKGRGIPAPVTFVGRGNREANPIAAAVAMDGPGKAQAKGEY